VGETDYYCTFSAEYLDPISRPLPHRKPLIKNR
jgi:hypothetical protein